MGTDPMHIYGTREAIILVVGLNTEHSTMFANDGKLEPTLRCLLVYIHVTRIHGGHWNLDYYRGTDESMASDVILLSLIQINTYIMIGSAQSYIKIHIQCSPN